MIRSKVVVPHKKNCEAVRYTEDGSWPHTWCEYVDEYLWKNKNFEDCGKREMWYTYRCNCKECDGKIAVAAVDVLSSIRADSASAGKGT